ncbi:gdp-mannose 4 6 dehydratase [Lucifera butyrica]|uniref:Gdp-mannose 4 6 dehydratase n=1 Tax=Lucifera butyrica TaxID=1351585 RepID=A0A498RDD2_9FIRM|nr:GDP-mannose 4,6-dehydratase [Lucifera butyrica]VBB09319.1 gdp-mannose 4 6 dehydratase [Lucifera butyrica]
MRVLVTGAGGFVGRYMVTELLRRGHEVFAGVIQDGMNGTVGVRHIGFDVTDFAQTKDAICQVRPDGIVHLAAQSMVTQSWSDPAATVYVNTIGTVNVAMAIREIGRPVKMVNIGTSEEYGLAGKAGFPLMEDAEGQPQNPYASSKLAAGQIVLQMAAKDNLNIIHVRPFNHFGPGQRVGFVISDFASQISKIEQGLAPRIIRVGNLNVKRDFTDVRDVILAYAALLENSVQTGTYNVCSGIPRNIGGILNGMIEMAKVSIDVEIDKSRFRPSDVPLFVGSQEKISKTVGWRPRRDFAESLQETMDWWRQQDFTAAATE